MQIICIISYKKETQIHDQAKLEQNQAHILLQFLLSSQQTLFETSCDLGDFLIQNQNRLGANLRLPNLSKKLADN